jgi:plasmid maintenance system antidote protein VapI
MYDRGTTPNDLAVALSVSPELISKLKKGDLKNPTLDTAIAISKYFDISLQTLALDILNRD